MLKYFFWILLLANAGLFAYRHGLPDAGNREPARMNNQLNADKVKLIPGPVIQAVAANSAASAAPAAPAPTMTATTQAARMDSVDRADISACTEIGNFHAAEARRFQARLAALSLGARVTQRGIQEAVSHIVYIPPQGDREAADRKVEELRRLGIQDLYVIQDDSNLRWAISLGVFKQEEGARTHLAELMRKGVRLARVGPYGTATTMVAFQLRGLDADSKARVAHVKEDFPRQEMRGC
jgi:hypothetical protein